MFLRNWARLYSNQTAPERIFETVIAQLGKPYRTQHPFFRYHIIADFVVLDDRIIFEIDGPSHDNPRQRYKDITRDIRLEEDGWRVVRIRNETIMAGIYPNDLPMLVATRPTLEELRTRLSLLPEPSVQHSKRRVRRKELAPKSARKRPKSA